MTTQHTPLARIVEIVNDVERRGHALNELAEIRDIARAELSQRDALAEALKRCLDRLMASPLSEMGLNHGAIEQARAALASVKGEAR